MDVIKKEIRSILDTMDIPEQRKELTEHNVRWLLRNIHFRNPDCEGCMQLLKNLALQMRNVNGNEPHGSVH